MTSTSRIVASIRIRSGTAAEWAASDPVLDEDEIGFDKTNLQFRVGDGVTAWSSLGVNDAGLSEAEVDTKVSTHVADQNAHYLLQTNAEAGNHTLTLDDVGALVSVTAAGTITVPPASSVAWPTGTVIGVRRTTSDTVTVAEGLGVTINNLGSGTLPFQYSEVWLHYMGSDVWVASASYDPLADINELSSNRDAALTDVDTILENRGASNYTLTIQDVATTGWPVGSTFCVTANSTGTVTVAAGSNVTLDNAGTVSQDGFATLIHMASNRWIMVGDQV